MQTVHHSIKYSSIDLALNRLEMNYIHKTERSIEILIALFEIPEIEVVGKGGL